MEDYGYMDGYLKKKFSNSNDYQFDKPMVQEDSAPALKADTAKDPMISPEFAKGAARGAGGGLGSMVMSGGMASASPLAMAGGLGLMALEGDAQGRQAEEEAKAIEAQQRKQAQLAAINNLIGVSKGLSVM
jgi:hypothetical protein